MEQDVASWNSHVIVCGLHGVSLLTIEQLHLAGVRVAVVVDQPDPRLTRQLSGWGIPQVAGDPRVVETLHEVGIAGAASVVCVLADDLHTLETALLAREVRPSVRVVAQIRNPAVGRALTDVDIAVLDVATLSAPSVVEACLRTGVHAVDLGGECFVAVSTTTAATSSPAPLRRRYGDLAPIAVSPADGAPVVLCPGRDYQVQPGDEVTVLGTRAELDAAGIEARKPVVPGHGRLREIVASLLSIVDRRLIIVLACLVTLIVTSTAVLHLGYREPNGTRMSILDALYFTVETVATIGYGDFAFRDQPTALRAFAIVLMLVGAVLATVFFALLTNLYVSRGIADALGRRLATGLSGHVVVVGLGSIGIRVVEQLRAAGRHVVVIDKDENNRYLTQVRTCGARIVIADATLPGTLAAVNLPAAAAVAVLTSDDLVNLETGLAVRDRLGRDWPRIPVVLRLFDMQLASTIERNFGFRFVRSTAALAAPWFVGAVLGLDVLGTFYVADEPVLVGRLTVAPDDGLDGLAMRELSAQTRIIAISRAADGGLLEHPPRGDTRLHAGDRAYLIGPYVELLQVLRRDTLSPAQIIGDNH